MPKQKYSQPELLEHHICKLIQRWEKTCPSILWNLKVKQKEWDDFLLKSAKDRANFVKKHLIFLPNSGTWILKSIYKKQVTRKGGSRNAKIRQNV